MPTSSAARVQRLTERLDTLRVSLEAGGRTTRLDQASDPAQVAVVVEATGTAYAPRQALVRLQDIHDQLAAAYDESVQGTLTELLGSAFIEHLRDRLTELRRLTGRINDVLAAASDGDDPDPAQDPPRARGGRDGGGPVRARAG